MTTCRKKKRWATNIIRLLIDQRRCKQIRTHTHARTHIHWQLHLLRWTLPCICNLLLLFNSYLFISSYLRCSLTYDGTSSVPAWFLFFWLNDVHSLSSAFYATWRPCFGCGRVNREKVLWLRLWIREGIVRRTLWCISFVWKVNKGCLFVWLVGCHHWINRMLDLDVIYPRKCNKLYSK